MAILKHVSVRNTDYGALQRYLLFEQDAVAHKPLRNEHGDMIPRQGILQTGLNCDPFTFNTECTELNRAVGKNLSNKDVTAHHYILSFDPRDDLSTEHAHEIGLAFARYFFDGHQALVVTHPDGHNGACNIHCHTMLNSVRKYNVEWKDFMERPTDALAGYKHHQTRALLRHMQIWIEEMCEREHLHAVDFVLPADEKITNREYWAQQRGQGNDTATVRQQLRDAIDDAVRSVSSFEGLAPVLFERYGIEMKESRGVISFKHPDRDRPFRGKQLGRNYERSVLEDRVLGHENPVPVEYEPLPRIFLIRSDLRLVTDIQTCVKAQQSRAYARKVTISNLQLTARSLAYIQNHGIGTLDKLNAACEQAERDYRQISDELSSLRQKMTGTNEQIHYLGQYLSTKNVYAAFLKSPDKAAYRAAHPDEIDRYEAARNFFKDGTFPKMDDLKAEKTHLQKEINRKRAEFKPLSDQRKTLQIVRHNINAILDEPHKTHDQNINAQ